MDNNENAEWGPPLYCGADIPVELAAPADGHHKMHCDLRFAIESLQMAPPDAVAYYEPPDGRPLRLIVQIRKDVNRPRWGVLLQDDKAPRTMLGDQRVFITNMPGVLGKTMNEVLAECQRTQQSRSKTP